LKFQYGDRRKDKRCHVDKNVEKKSHTYTRGNDIVKELIKKSKKKKNVETKNYIYILFSYKKKCKLIYKM
jgi:hypothetical protein